MAKGASTTGHCCCKAAGGVFFMTSNLPSRACEAAPFQTCTLVCTDYCKISSWPSHLLTEAATVSAAVARTVLTAVTNGLDLFDQPAIVLDRLGVVLGTNATAESSFDDKFRIETRRLIVGDKLADAALVQATQDDAAFPIEPIIVKSYRTGATGRADPPGAS
jgi:hypothetical protein